MVQYELPRLGLEPGAPGCKSDALPNELKGYPTSSVLVGRRIIPQHSPPLLKAKAGGMCRLSSWARLTRTRLVPHPIFPG